MSNSSVWPIDRILSGATNPGQIGSGSDVSEEVYHNPQSSKTGASPSDCLMSYPGHSLEEYYPSTEMQVSIFYGPSWLDHMIMGLYIKLARPVEIPYNKKPQENLF